MEEVKKYGKVKNWKGMSTIKIINREDLLDRAYEGNIINSQAH